MNGKQKCNSQSQQNTDASGPKVEIPPDYSLNRIEKALKKSREKYHSLFANMLEGVAYCRIILDDQGKPVDFVYLEVNDAFETLTGLKKTLVTGKKVSKAIPGITKAHPELFEIYGEVALSGGERRFELYFKPLAMWLYISVYSPKKGYFVAIFDNITQRKKNEIALAQSEEKYRMLFEGATDAILVADAETGTIIECNPATLKMFGKTRAELIGQHQSSLHPKKIGENGFTDIFKEHLKGPTRILETQIITKTGEVRDVAILPGVFEFDGRKFIQGTFRDITERKKAAEHVKNLKEFDERIIDSLGEALLIIDPEDYTILNANKTACDQLKFEREKLIGRTCYEATHALQTPCMSPDHVCPIREMLKTGMPATAEHIHFDIDHHEVFVEISVSPVRNIEGKTVVIHIAKDVTKKKTMENELQVSEEKFRAISNSVRDAIILVDNEARIQYWNPAAEKTFGYFREDALGKEVHKLIVPYTMCADGKARIKAGFKEFSQTGKGAFVGENVELIGRRSDGLEFPVKLSLSPIKLGGKWYAVGVAKDITERKKAEQIAKEYAQRLEKAVAARTNELQAAQKSLLKLERLAAIGELAGMVGHDLRNPLSGIKNAAFYLEKKSDMLTDQSKAMLKTIEKCVEHSNKIINDLQDYSREMHLELEDRSPKSLLLNALELVQIPEKIKLHNDLGDEPLLEVDPEKIERVFINLIKNAVDAMPDGGEITVKGKETDGGIEISISDTGTGIADQVLPKLFSPLSTTKAQGMGFGLAICKRVVEAHGGKIEVKTAQGVGTTFTIILPIEVKKNVGVESAWIKTPKSLLLTTTQP